MTHSRVCIGQCPAERTDAVGTCFCTLSEGHGGPHQGAGSGPWHLPPSPLDRYEALRVYAELITGVAESICDVIETPESFSKVALANLAKRMRRAINDQTGSAKAAGAPGAESTAAPTHECHETDHQRHERGCFNDQGGVMCQFCGGDLLPETKRAELRHQSGKKCGPASLDEVVQLLESARADEAFHPDYNSALDYALGLLSPLRHQVGRNETVQMPFPCGVIEERVLAEAKMWRFGLESGVIGPELVARIRAEMDSQSVACTKQEGGQ